MAIRADLWRKVILSIAVLVLMLIGGMAFVLYFMHMVYETKQVLDPAEVPPKVQSALALKHPGLEDVEWEREEGLYLAVFSWQGHEELEVYFRPDGGWHKTEQAIEADALPDKARAYLDRQQGYELKDKERITHADGRITYEVELAGRLQEIDCTFDHLGNLLTRERDGSTLETPPGEEE